MQAARGSDDTIVSGTRWTWSSSLTAPGFTVLYHPDLRRVGERASLLPAMYGADQRLSRCDLEFIAPDGARRGPLDDRHLSRRPIQLRRGHGDATLHLDASHTRTGITIEGERLTGSREFTAEEIRRGIVLLLDHHVVLLLHMFHPDIDSPSPDLGLVGASSDMVGVRRHIQRVADLDVPVLVRGETGTGKELVAQAIHRAGPRCNGPYIAVNMAAIPANLAAVELFGARKGAFTGAERQRDGYFHRARGGTLFLDEIGEMPLEVQVLLLRALETGEIQQVGADAPTTTDVRVISATDADLEDAIVEQRFRAPILHRLNGYLIKLPPLRRRRDDFGQLFVYFLRRELDAIGESRRLASRTSPWIPAGLVARLAALEWPGNVRQLRNVVRQLVIANRGAEQFTVPDLVHALIDAAPAPPRPRPAAPALAPAAGKASRPAVAGPSAARDTGRAELRPSDIREPELIAALRANHWRPKDAADQLGIPRSSIYRLIDKCSRIRKASQLSRDEILASCQRHDGRVDAMSEEFEVSAIGLRRRMGHLGLA